MLDLSTRSICSCREMPLAHISLPTTHSFAVGNTSYSVWHFTFEYRQTHTTRDWRCVCNTWLNQSAYLTLQTASLVKCQLGSAHLAGSQFAADIGPETQVITLSTPYTTTAPSIGTQFLSNCAFTGADASSILVFRSDITTDPQGR